MGGRIFSSSTHSAKWMVEMYSHKQRNNTIYENNDAAKLKEIDVDLLRLSY